MKRHAYEYRGIGHFSHLDGPKDCCYLPERHYIHRCPEAVPPFAHPHDWRYCGLPYGHEGDHQVAEASERVCSCGCGNPVGDS